MGCSTSASTRSCSLFGVKGVHVGRDGDVDLVSRNINFFGIDFVQLINSDVLHTAKRLHLSDNRLYTLGKELVLLPCIEELYINTNLFERLPSVLGDMLRLSVLDASSNNLGRQQHALDVAPRITNLTRLVLRNCSLGTIPLCVLRCPALKELDVSDNKHILLEGVQFALLPLLSRLFIANCSIVGEIPSGVKALQTLETLDISGNVFDFENANFFGKNLVNSLTELQLRDMCLSAVPHVVIQLRNLASLDISKNPIETLDVLAGRLVREQPLHTPMKASVSSNLATDANDDAVSVGSQSSNGINYAQNNRKGRIVAVPQPTPLKKLSLRACDLSTLPKYFHRLNSLVELDLSDNDKLDDPNISFSSLKNLQQLNILGCPFAVNIRTAQDEWFDIGNLNSLHTLHWELWKGGHNISPYRTRVPLEICGLNLRRINNIELREGLFVGDTVQTMVNLLMDGYFKVDIAIDDELLYSHIKAVRTLHPLGWFFFSCDAGDGSGGDTIGSEEAAADAVPRTTQEASIVTDSHEEVADNAVKGGVPMFPMNKLSPRLRLRQDLLQVVISRYIFFLTMQGANHKAVIVPPVDVMVVHYAQMTQDPEGYRKDCDAICRQVLNCNYRMLFLQQEESPQMVKETLKLSKQVWNKMIRTVQRDLHWLHYDFWEWHDECPLPTAAGGLGDEHVSSILEKIQHIFSSAGVCGPFNGTPGVSCGRNTLDKLRHVQSVEDLSAVLDPYITSYFREQGIERFAEALKRFFTMNDHFIHNEERLKNQFMDWTRYVKYLALYAYIKRLNGTEKSDEAEDNGGNELKNLSIFSSDSYLPRPQKSLAPLQSALRRTMHRENADTAPTHSRPATTPQPRDEGHGNHSSASSARHGKRDVFKSVLPRKRPSIMSHVSDTGRHHKHRLSSSEPVPTIGITLLLHCHRTDHVKYHKVLRLLGIDSADITWDETTGAVEETMRSWELLYGERYVENPSVAFVSYKAASGTHIKSHADFLQEQTVRKSALQLHKRVKSRRSDRCHREVAFCCADSQEGVY